MRSIADWVLKNRLVTILLVAYFVVAGIVFEQGRVIENQRTLIHQLFSDSMELHAVRTQAAPSHRHN